jgi:hypothetical protein
MLYRSVVAVFMLNFLFRSAVQSLFVSRHPAISRTLFLSQATTLLSSSIALQSSAAQTCFSMDEPLSLLNSVYGQVNSPSFPLPMPEDEAGLCADGHQRRYLWTDAFGVLCYTSIAEHYKAQGNTTEAEKYKRAADRLVNVVHACLGSPRSNKPEDRMTMDTSSPTGHVGLRIGKLYSRKVTDYGMTYDGQYWHYVDKWLLALARSGHVKEGIEIAKSCFPYFFDPGEDGTGWAGGIRWKLNVDATAPPSLQRARASDDTLVALIVFSILEAHRDPTNKSLADEIKLLKVSLQGYRPRVTDDPLGWGLEAMYDQFLKGHPRQASLKSLQSSALHPSHLSLPFRLYGAMIGARIGGESVAHQDRVNQLVELSLKHEGRAAASGVEEHSSINRVMLAMCLLCPGALGRQPNDPVVTIDG